MRRTGSQAVNFAEVVWINEIGVDQILLRHCSWIAQAKRPILKRAKERMPHASDT